MEQSARHSLHLGYHTSCFFDPISLLNGVTRDFRARVGSLDGESSQELDREEGKIRSDTNKGGDARSVGEGRGGWPY